MLAPYLDLPANQAAVLGYAPSVIYLNERHPNLEFSASRYNVANGCMLLEVSAKDSATRAVFEALPSLSDYTALEMWKGRSEPGCFEVEGGELRADGVPFEEILKIMGGLHRLGYVFQSKLANLQAQVAADVGANGQSAYVGASAGFAEAHNDFVDLATGLLERVAALKLTALATKKGIRQVDHPFRALALAHRASGVLVAPDPHEAHFVGVTFRGLSRGDKLILRTLAYEYFDNNRMYVQLYEM